MMSRIRETIGGLWQLFALAARSRFRMNSAYWRWRKDTAFGHDPAKRPSRAASFQAMLDYGRWVHRMKQRL